MCGIIAYAGDLTHTELTAFKNLLIADTVRGKHSTGLAYVPSSSLTCGRRNVVKALMNGLDFVDTYMDRVGDTTSLSNRVLIGHNRHATQGAVSKLNAHPFLTEDETIVGCHNGTIYHEAFKELRVNRSNYNTDSEALFNNIEQEGGKETLEGLVGGAWAVVWYNNLTETLNFAHNSERPLAAAVSKSGKGMLLASEAKMLEWALDRNNLSSSWCSVKELAVDTLFTVAVRRGSAKPIELVSETALTVKKPTPTSVVRTPSDSASRGTNVVSIKERRRTLTAGGRVADTVQPETTEDTALGAARSETGAKMSISASKKYLRKHGDTHGADCIWCSEPLIKTSAYVACSGGPICSACAGDTKIQQQLADFGLQVNWA